jgi:hypothetical protein
VEKIVSSSEFIAAREVKPDDSTAQEDSVHFEIIIGPGIKSGLLSEQVVISFKDDVRAPAKIFVYGIVVDDIEVSPLKLTYVVTGDSLQREHMSRKLTVTNYDEDHPLEIIDVTTPGDFLDMTVKTLEDGRQMEITAVATEKVLGIRDELDNKIHIITNNPDMRIVKVPYTVVRR